MPEYVPADHGLGKFGFEPDPAFPAKTRRPTIGSTFIFEASATTAHHVLER